ncbi:hypothetical protein ACQ4PT_041312 [Festuca glaucescens]
MVPLAKELRHNLATLKSSKVQPEDGIIVAKVRHLTRNVCNSEYDPDHVSIGPYNHPRQLPTQHDKLRSLDAVLSWVKHGTTVEVYINELACLEPKARSCYNNTFDDIPEDQFVRMLLLDGCYILHRFVNFQAQPTTNDVGAAANGSSIPSVLAASPDFQAQPTTNDAGTAANGSSIPSVLAASPDIQAQPTCTTNDEGTSANASSIASVLAVSPGFQAQPTTNDAGTAANGGSIASVLAVSPGFQAQPTCTTNDEGTSANASSIASVLAVSPGFQAQPTTNDAGTAANGGSIASVLAVSPGFQAQPTTNDAGSAVNGGSTRSTSAAEMEALEVVRDVFFLAENQIPFFVLEKIGELTVPDGRARVGRWIADYARDLMEDHKYGVPAPAMVPPEPTVRGNLLHLLHMQLKPESGLFPDTTGISAADESASVGRWRKATEYSYAGVKFKVRAMSENESVRCILDVRLDSSGGTLEVPRLDIDNETWRLLRNLMELEQRNREAVGSHVTAYCVFMSQLASDRKDVELLSKRGVIVHAHGNDGEVAHVGII